MLRRPPSLLSHFVALTLSALLLALSYPLPGWDWAAWFALVPAGWLAATSRSRWRLMWTSAIVFGLWWVWMLRWLWPVTLPGAVATALVQSLFWVAALWATNLCVRRQRIPVAVALPLCWVALEYVRCTWPWGGFAWFTLAQTQAAWESSESFPILPQTSIWFGAWGTSLWLALVNGFLASASVRELVIRDRQRRLEVRRVPAIVVAISVGSLIVSLLGTPELPITRSEQHPTRIAVVQTNSPHSNKLSPTVATYEAEFAALERLHAEASEATGEAAEARPVLIVWPETTVPGKFNDAAQWGWERWLSTLPPDTPDLDLWRVRVGAARRAKQLIARHGVPTLVGGSTEIETADPRDPVTHNSAFLVSGEGEIIDRYDKMHRVPFGEYIPLPEGLKRWVLATVSPYDFDYSIEAGKRVTVFGVGGSEPAGLVGGPPRVSGAAGDRGAEPEPRLRFATPICFEDTDAALCRAMVYDPDTGEKRVDALINLTTNGWFGHLPSEERPEGGLAWRSVRYQHMQLASLRAIENRVPVVRAVNTGVSAIIDSTGRIVAIAEPGEAAVLRSELVLDSRRTLYAAVGDWPIRALAGLTLVLVAWSRLARPAVVRRRARRG